MPGLNNRIGSIQAEADPVAIKHPIFPPFTNTPLGIETTPFYGRYNFIAGPLTALLFWLHYDFLKDREVLRSTIFPFLKEACSFFLAYMRKGKDGKYFLYPAYPSEQSRTLGFERNPTGTLMMVKALLQNTLSACRELDIEGSLAARIEEMLEHFPEYPSGRGCFLQSEDEPDPKFYRHLSRVEAGFQNGEIDPDTPSRERSLLIGSLKAFKKDKYWAPLGGPSWAIFPMGGSLAYLKWPDEVMRHLYGFAIAHCLKPNGMISDYGIYGRNIVKRHEVSTPVTERLGGVCNTVAEMLLRGRALPRATGIRPVKKEKTSIAASPAAAPRVIRCPDRSCVTLGRVRRHD